LGFAHHAARGALLAGFAYALVGCGARASTVAGYIADPLQAKAWNALRPGQRIIVFDPQGTCPAVVAPTLKDLNSSAEPISRQPWAGGAAIFTIQKSTLQPPSGDSQASILLDLVGTQGRLAMRWTPDGKASCVWPYSAAVEEALPWVGSTRVFAPWKSECTRIEAAGVSPDAVLIESEPGQTVKIEAVELGSASASQLRSWTWQEPVVIWFKTNRGTLHLRGDTLRTCFVDPDDPSATPPDDPMAWIRTDPSRCSREEVDGKEHVECATSLGVWEGIADQRAVSLRFVRRTLGSFHVIDGRPVKGDRFARTVVAVQMDAPSHEREGQLYSSMQAAVASVFSEDDGMVRVAPAGDPSVTLLVAAAVRDLRLGDLEVREEKQQSEYEHHKETRPNPDKPRAMAAVETARGDLEQARTDFELRKEEERRNHETCMNGCNSLSDTSSRNGCQIGCGVLSMVTAEDDSSVVAARTKLAEAQQVLARTPDTVDVPVMAKWDYTKKVYSRSISASLEMEIGFRSGPRRTSVQLSDAVTDYEVSEDPAHGVTGHSPNRDIIDRPESLLPLIAQRLSIQLGKELRAAINQERQEAAIQAFAESGGELPKAEYRAVDAMAFEAVGKRLRKALHRGLATPKPGDPVSLPSAALEMSPKDCLLAVAVSEGSASVEIRLATPNGSHADLRKKSFAVVELCGSELESGGQTTSELVLSTSEAASVRWGLYRVAVPDANDKL
jgi:hypothetical protein